MHGQGLLKMADGSWVKGDWQAGQLQKGHWSSADGKTEYEGQFRGMAWHGFGTMHQTGVKKYMGKEHFSNCSQNIGSMLCRHK